MNTLRLMLIADWPTLLGRYGATERAIEAVDQALAGAARSPAGSVMVMERDRRSGGDDRPRFDRLRRLLKIAHAHDCMFVVNHRCDLAAAVGADGVQLPERGLPAGPVKRSFPGLAVGRSCHDRAGLLRAQQAGADWATLGPVHAPLSKVLRGGERPLGPQGYAEATVGLSLPVFALGGITPQNASQHSRVASIGAVLLANSPAEVLERLLNAPWAI